jgi:hypothetical protein
MRSSSPLLSYQQVLETRQCALSEREVTLLLTQLLTEIAKLHVVGKIHGYLNLDQLWRDVEGDLYMHPAAQYRVGWTPRDDVRSIAQLAISLLTNQPFHPDWQRRNPIRKPLAQVLAATLNFTTEIPIRDASDFLQALHRIHGPQTVEIPERDSLMRQPTPVWIQLWIQLLQFPGVALQFMGALGRLLLKLILGAGLLGAAGWMAYEHFLDLLPDNPRSIPANKPTPTATSTAVPKLILPTPKTPDP